jgi:uncharacterized YigZ family protein
MTNHSYRTITTNVEGVFKEKGSKFLAFAFPVESENEIKEHLTTLRKEYFDARHHCYAWMLGADKTRFRANDDGEPNHSAGDPILGQIRSRDLTNVLVVVVRYFGGVKLGVGGLIAAYKSAAEDALNKAVVGEKEVELQMTLRYNYDATPEAMRLIKEFDLGVIHQDFTDACRLTLAVTLRVKPAVEDKVILLRALGVDIQIEITQIPAQ